MAGLVLPMLAGLLFAGCDEPTGRAIKPADLYGTWAGETIGGRAFFLFQLQEQVNRFELWAAPGEFTDSLNSGEVILSKGRWGVAGTTLNLFDEGALYSYTCLGWVADPYEVIMNPAGDEMQLDYLGDNCTPRGQLLHSATWVRQEDNPEGAPGS